MYVYCMYISYHGIIVCVLVTINYHGIIVETVFECINGVLDSSRSGDLVIPGFPGKQCTSHTYVVMSLFKFLFSGCVTESEFVALAPVRIILVHDSIALWRDRLALDFVDSLGA